MKRLLIGAVALIALAGCHPAGNNLVPPARQVMDGAGGPPVPAPSPMAKTSVRPMDGAGGPPVPKPSPLTSNP